MHVCEYSYTLFLLIIYTGLFSQYLLDSLIEDLSPVTIFLKNEPIYCYVMKMVSLEVLEIMIDEGAYVGLHTVCSVCCVTLMQVWDKLSASLDFCVP